MQETELAQQQVSPEVRQAFGERKRPAALADITRKRREKAASTLTLARQRTAAGAAS